MPAYTGSGWYAYAYKTHLNGAQNWFANITSPKKLLLAGPAHLERPFHTFHREILRWHDHWFKGIDTGIMRRAAGKILGDGREMLAHRHRLAAAGNAMDQALSRSWDRLRRTAIRAVERDRGAAARYVRADADDADQQRARLRYMTEPLPQDMLVAGPMALTLFASIDQDDTNWIVILKDVGPDVSVMSGARRGAKRAEQSAGARDHPRLAEGVAPRDSTRSAQSRGGPGTSSRARRSSRSSPARSKNTRSRCMSTANLFRKGHRICLDITSMDLPTGVAGATNAEYMPYHICSSKTVVHRVYRDRERPSHLLLPVIPTSS